VDAPRVLTRPPTTTAEEEPMQRRQLASAALTAVAIALAIAACTASPPDTPVPGEVARVDYTQASGVVSSRTESPPQAAVAYVVTAACRATGAVELTYVVHQGNIVVTSGSVPCGAGTVRSSVGDLQRGPAADITLTGDLTDVSAAFATVGPSM
jgi:hypothetical protein